VEINKNIVALTVSAYSPRLAEKKLLSIKGIILIEYTGKELEIKKRNRSREKIKETKVEKITIQAIEKPEGFMNLFLFKGEKK